MLSWLSKKFKKDSDKNNIEYVYLGKGEYGAVFSPALPNIIDNNPRIYPNNVTKVFFNKADYNSILNKKNVIREIMGEDVGYPYVHQYKMSNLRNTAIDIYEDLSVTKSFKDNDDLYLMRMPDLGEDASHIYKIKKQLLKIPIKTILQQISKLLNQTASLEKHKYIHGDIRDLNLMVEPNTGKMTIIDYDWFLPFDIFLKEYSVFGFYNNPPEWLIKYPTMFDSYVADNYVYFQHALNLTTDQIREKVSEANKINEEYIKNKETYFNSTDSLLTFDNYGLALSLLNIINQLYTPIPTSLEKTVSLLKKMSSMRIDERPTPTEAAAEMDAILKTKFKGGNLTYRKRRISRAKTRSKKNK